MAPVNLTFWFDAEDYTSPYEPVCLQRLTEIFARRRLCATWKLVGEEARMLLRAAAGGSTDRDGAAAREALRAMAAQDVGFHTDWHSVHPTVAEYCTDAGWEEGQRRVDGTESPGLAALRQAFPDKRVVCYGQPGGSWAPQVYPVLRRWGIPLYMDEAGHLGLDEEPFFYCGVLNVLRLRHFCFRHRGHLPPRDGATEALADLDRIAGALRAQGGGLAQCWWHPNEWYTDQWWDGLNFGGGVNRVSPRPDGRTEYRIPQPVADDERERRFASAEAFVDAVARRSDVHVCGGEDIVAMYPDRARGRAFTEAELAVVAQALADQVTYQRHGAVTLSAAEAAYLLAAALAAPAPPSEVALDASPDGPAARAACSVPPSASRDEVRRAAAGFMAQVRRQGRLPDALPLAGGIADPACLATAFAAAYQGRDPVPLSRPRLLAEDHVRGEGVWNWSIFAEGFRADDLIELGRLQAWTLKPAVAST